MPEPLLISNSTCPLKVQISLGLSTSFQIELLKTGRTLNPQAQNPQAKNL